MAAPTAPAAMPPAQGAPAAPPAHSAPRVAPPPAATVSRQPAPPATVQVEAAPGVVPASGEAVNEPLPSKPPLPTSGRRLPAAARTATLPPTVCRANTSRRKRTAAARSPPVDAGMTCLAAYLLIVKGTPRVRRTSVQAAAALVAASTSIESSNPELRLSVQLSGGSATGTTSWVSLFGSGRLRDPAVLRVQSHIHHFSRGLDGLLQAGNSFRCEEAHLVGDYAGGDPSASSSERPGRPPRGAVDSTHEENLEAMTSPSDSSLPPPPGILEEVRDFHRATVGAGDVVEPDRSLDGRVPPEARFSRGPLYNGVDLNAPAGSASADSSRLGDGSGSIQGGETGASRSS